MKPTILIGLVGPKLVGKTTFGRSLRALPSPSARCSMATPLHDVYAAFTQEVWGKYSKDDPWPEGSCFGVVTRRELIKKLANGIETGIGRAAMLEAYRRNLLSCCEHNRLVMVDDVRRQDEADMVVSAGGKLVGLSRSGVEWDDSDPFEVTARDIKCAFHLRLPTLSGDSMHQTLGRIAHTLLGELYGDKE